MSTPLHDIIAERIRYNGPLRLDIFMELCLTHHEHGYYVTRDPFGVTGDFTTAPEISQMFGEMIGAWLADLWIKFGRPERFILLECGPGRGTLMSDALRAIRNVKGFHEAMQICLMEISPVLKKMQAEKLQDYAPRWIENFDNLEACPVFIIGNEFLDALPIRQFVCRDGKWRERHVATSDNDTLSYIDIKSNLDSVFPLPERQKFAGEGAVYETSPAVDKMVEDVCIILRKQRGAALFCDYGYIEKAPGDSFQALKNNRFVNPLASPGEQDLTAHVDFGGIVRRAGVHGVATGGPVTQGAFLKALGIDARAEILMRNATKEQQRDIASGLLRLTDQDEAGGMGGLFKVCALWHDGRCDDTLTPAGFP